MLSIMRVLYPFIALFISTAAYPQGSGFGVKLGGNYSHLASSAAAENEFLFGAVGGFYFPILASSRFEIQPELLFSMQGGGHSFPSSKTVTRLYYLTVPITGKLYFNNWLNIQGGPQLGYMVNANSQKNDEASENTSEDFHTHDFSFLMGVGFDNRQGIDISIRYLMGMTTLLREDENLYPRNRVVQISVGYRFGQVSSRRRR